MHRFCTARVCELRTTRSAAGDAHLHAVGDALERRVLRRGLAARKGLADGGAGRLEQVRHARAVAAVAEWPHEQRGDVRLREEAEEPRDEVSVREEAVAGARGRDCRNGHVGREDARGREVEGARGRGLRDEARKRVREGAAMRGASAGSGGVGGEERRKKGDGRIEEADAAGQALDGRHGGAGGGGRGEEGCGDVEHRRRVAARRQRRQAVRGGSGAVE